MGFSSTWRRLLDRCRSVDPDAVLVTPSSDRAFEVVSAGEDAVVLEDVESGAERSLRRTEFEVLYDRLAADPEGMSISDLPVGVEPYVAVLSLAPGIAIDESGGIIRRSETADGTESPFLRPEWTVREPPERVHDDAVLLADLLERYDVEDLESLAPERLVDLYVLLSDVQHGADRLRKAVGDLLLEYIGPDADLRGRFGTVHRTIRERRRLEDEEVVLDALDEAGIPREWVMAVDPEKLDVVLAVTDLDERAVYDVEEQVYVQKTAVEEEQKQSRLEGLRARLAALESEDAEELREDIEELEERLDAVLAAG
ncbi:MAG: hypothetical protein V5A85_03425 [Haloarculaceae archaeon]